MSFISDFKSAPLQLFTSTAGGTTTAASDASPTTLCGTRFASADGREFVLVLNGAVALVSGVVVQSPASVGANHTGLTCSTAVAGATTISLTMGGTACTANQYQGGYLVISAGTGAGQTLRIASHPAGTSAAVVVFTLEDPLSVATLTSDSKGSLTLNPFTNVIISPTTATGSVVGVSLYPIPAASYGYLVRRGVCGVLNDSNTAIGLDIMPSSSVAGAVVTYVVATRSRIGTASVAGETTKTQLANIQL